VPGDEAQDVTHVPNRPRTGPRHAAPKKALLTRLQIPAGKAIALAAMPTAVLMGMGLAPRFVAHADEAPTKDTIKPGPCVTASDKPSEDAKTAKDGKDGGKDAKGGKDATGTSGDKGGASGKGSGHLPGVGVSPSPSAQSGAPTKTPKKSSGGTSGTHNTPTPTQSSGTSGSGGSGGSGGSSGGGGLLDPILDPIGSILGMGGSGGSGGSGGQTATPKPTATATPKPTASSPHHSGGSGGTGGSGSSDSSGPSGSSPKHSGTHAGTSAVKKSTDVKKPADATASPSPTASPTLPPPDADGKIPYPCPEEKKVAGQDEQTPNILANKPWMLKATRLDLHGLAYDGVVNVRTADGTVKQALKFRASGVDIKDLHQLVDGPLGVTMHITARKGSTSTIRGGEVTMYTEKLSGNLLGLVPITFTPDFPPPLTLPELFFTDVTVVQAGQFGGNLTVPGLHGYSTGP
jgi:hypothetical protein